MAKHVGALVPQTRTESARGNGTGSRIRASRTLPALAFLACTALIMVPMVDPTTAFAISDQIDYVEANGGLDGQSLTASGDYQNDVSRADFIITQEVIAKAESTAPVVGKPDPGSAKSIAYDLVQKKGWGDKQFACLVALWNRESHWNVYAGNQASGAYGIPQSVPGNKMASIGPNWKSDAKTQIVWGLGYISSRYGTPCGAWASSEERGWY